MYTIGLLLAMAVTSGDYGSFCAPGHHARCILCWPCQQRYTCLQAQSFSGSFDYRSYFDYPWSQDPIVPPRYAPRDVPPREVPPPPNPEPGAAPRDAQSPTAPQASSATKSEEISDALLTTAGTTAQ
jgi:hypothetical protein